MMLKIVDTRGEHDVINIKSITGETVLHLAAEEGLTSCVRQLIELGADLSIQDVNGDTVLHRLVKATVNNPLHLKRHLPTCTFLEVFDTILEKVVKWWNKKAYIDRTELNYNTLKKEATLCLVNDILNIDGLSVIRLSLKVGAVGILSRLFMMPDVIRMETETVLHLAAEEGLTSCVRQLIELGADLSIHDVNGDTVLHRLVKATVNNPLHLKRHLEVLNEILEMAVKWWSKKLCIGRIHDKEKELKKEATLHLLYDILNKDGLSVITLSFKVGAVDVLSTLLMIRDVTRFKDINSGCDKFDVTQILPQLNRKLFENGSARVAPTGIGSVSGMEVLITETQLPRTVRIKLLDIPPVNEVVKYYESLFPRTYLLLMVLHVIYMSILTYVGFDLSAKLRDEKSASNLLLYICVPIEPIYIIVYMTWNFALWKCRLKTAIMGVWSLRTSIVFYTYTGMYATVVIVWIILVSIRWNYQDYFLAASLCLGWLFPIYLARCVNDLYNLVHMLVIIIWRDFTRFAFLFVFVLFAFGFAFHAMLIISPEVIQVFHTPMSTLFLSFEWMTGRGELFNEEFEKKMDDAGRELTYFKLYYIVYIVLSSVILINLLIAMMNNTYKALEDDKLTPRLEAIFLGKNMESTIAPTYLRKLLSSIQPETGNKGIVLNQIC